MASEAVGAHRPATGVLPGTGSETAALEAEVERAQGLFLHGRPAAAARLLRSTRRRVRSVLGA